MSRVRSYFVSEERSNSMFSRQSSELSDSKVSSAPDTESIGSTGSLGVPAFGEEKTSIMKVTTDAEEAIAQELELIYAMGDASEVVGHGSESSEDDSIAYFNYQQSLQD